MNKSQAKSLDQSIMSLEKLYNNYVMGTAPSYKVRVIAVDRVSQYHVTNINTNVSHSEWKCYDTAMEVMRDLNRMTKKGA